jgi:polysaccharide biosynthesis/export protein
MTVVVHEALIGLLVCGSPSVHQKRNSMKTFCIKLMRFIVVPAVLIAQTPVDPSGGPVVPGPVNVPANVPATSPNQGPVVPEAPPDYVLGPEDQISIRALEADEISDKPVRISGDGFVNLAMIGRVHAAGLTVGQLETELSTRLEKYISHAQVTVQVTEFRSQPVSVLGAVNTTGAVQLRGRRSLLEVISLAGGLRQDAGSNVTITRQLSRGKLPLANAKTDVGNEFSIATVNLREIMNGRRPDENIAILPNDVITVPKAPLVYVLGEVNKPGGFVLDGRDSLSSLQAVALAGGLNKTAHASKSRLLRFEPGKTDRTETVTNLKSILEGQAPDINLHADDILFVPNNISKSASLRALEMAINVGTGIAIWHF